MKDIVSSVVLKERKPQKRNYTKKQPKPSEKMVKTKELVQEGYSLAKAMELAGYSPSTIKQNANLYMKKLDLDELRRGLKIQTALSSYKAFKVLDEKMDTAEKDQDQIKAAGEVLKAGKIHLGKDDIPTKIVWAFQTFKDTTINMTSPEKPDEIIDITSENGKGDSA